MSLFSINDKRLSLLKKTQFSTEGMLERQHLQAALKDNMSVLANDSLIIAEECSDWDDSRRPV